MDKNKTINQIIKNAIAEDACFHDITTQLVIPESKSSAAYILFKEPATICGLAICQKVFRELDPYLQFRSSFKDGDSVNKMTKVVFLKGKTRAILSAERVALNFLGYLSGIATRTQKFVKKMAPLKVKILDTRKTTPGLRILERTAVRCGGGVNHRFNLADMILIKDNHKVAGIKPRNLSNTIRRLKKSTHKKIEIEVDNLVEFKKALEAKPDIILLDNMSVQQMRKAVQLNRKQKSKTLLEASGGIHMNNVRSVAATGIDCISIGGLTHHHESIDVSLELVP